MPRVEKGERITIIKSTTGWFDINLQKIWEYKDLLFLFVKRDFTAIYKQTLLGPLWHFLQPLINSLIFSFAFSFIARISTDNIPPLLFYLSGIVPWAYFAECTTRTSNIFTQNAGIFGKVYFPRLIVPMAIVVSNLIRFCAQFSLLAVCYLYFASKGNISFHANYYALLTPLLLLLIACMGMGIGLIVSSSAIVYKDIVNLTGFGVQLLMYLSPVIFPVSIWPEKFRWIVFANPMTPVIQTFRYGFLSTGEFHPTSLLYSCCFAFALLFVGVLLFNRSEKNFIDTI